MLELLLEENVCKDPAKPWISNRQIHVGFGTVLTTLGWYTPPPWGGTDTTQALLLEENRSKDPAQPWISNRQRSVDSGTLLRPGKEFSLRPDTDPPLCPVFAFKQWSPPWQIPTVPTPARRGGGRRSV
jgi:hypothetical protein